MEKPTPQKYIHEFFSEVCAIKNRDERVKYLKENATFEAKTVLQLQWNEKIKLDLPKGKPPFVPCPEGRTPQPPNVAIRVLGNLTTTNFKYDRVKKETMFINLLETLCEEDSKIVCAAKDRNLLSTSAKKYSKMTLPLVKEALPELL